MQFGVTKLSARDVFWLRLLELRFLVLDVLARDGIEFHDLHLVGHRLLVLRGGVEVAGASTGLKLDFLSCHGDPPLNRFAASPQLGKHGIDTVLVYRAKRGI